MASCLTLETLVSCKLQTYQVSGIMVSSLSLSKSLPRDSMAKVVLCVSVRGKLHGMTVGALAQGFLY